MSQVTKYDSKYSSCQGQQYLVLFVWKFISLCEAETLRLFIELDFGHPLCFVICFSVYSRLPDLRWLCRHTLCSLPITWTSPPVLPVAACSTSDRSTSVYPLEIVVQRPSRAKSSISRCCFSDVSLQILLRCAPIRCKDFVSANCVICPFADVRSAHSELIWYDGGHESLNCLSFFIPVFLLFWVRL